MNTTENKKIEEIIKKEDADFQLHFERFKMHALKTVQILENYSIEDFNKQKSENPILYFETLINICFSLAFFYYDDLKYKKVKALEITDSVSRWFIGFDRIKEEFERIDGDGILVLRNSAFIMIAHYLKSKIMMELINNAAIITGDESLRKVTILEGLKLSLRRRNYRNKFLTSPMNQFDLFVDKMIDNVEILFDAQPKKANKLFINFHEGKTEKIHIKGLIQSLVPHKEMDGTEFAVKISGLMKLLLKDENYLLEGPEFGKGQALYGENYPRYLANRITKISGVKKLGSFDFG